MPRVDLKSGAAEDLVPPRARQIVVRQDGDSCPEFPTQSMNRKVGPANIPSQQMILDDDAIVSNPCGFAHEHAGVLSVMQHVDEQDAVEGAVAEWEAAPSNTVTGISVDGRWKTSTPSIAKSVRRFMMLAAIDPSPVPTSRTLASFGRAVARKLDSTRTLRSNTSLPCVAFNTSLALGNLRLL